jgi:hypothetical protein
MDLLSVKLVSHLTVTSENDDFCSMTFARKLRCLNCNIHHVNSLTKTMIFCPKIKILNLQYTVKKGYQSPPPRPPTYSSTNTSKPCPSTPAHTPAARQRAQFVSTNEHTTTSRLSLSSPIFFPHSYFKRAAPTRQSRTSRSAFSSLSLPSIV